MHTHLPLCSRRPITISSIIMENNTMKRYIVHIGKYRAIYYAVLIDNSYGVYSELRTWKQGGALAILWNINIM